jgi:hypothetical protein
MNEVKTYRVPLSEITLKFYDGYGNEIKPPCPELITAFRFTVEHPAIPEAPHFVKSLTIPPLHYTDSSVVMVEIETYVPPGMEVTQSSSSGPE